MRTRKSTGRMENENDNENTTNNDMTESVVVERNSPHRLDTDNAMENSANVQYGSRPMTHQRNNANVYDWRNPADNHDKLIIDDDDEPWSGQHAPYVTEIIEMIRNAGVSQKKIPADGDCCIHSVIGSLQINSSRYDISADTLIQRLNLRLGSNYWWNIEEMCTLVESIGFGLFAVQSEKGKNVLHYFNAQRILKRNIFVALKNNHYYVIDLKAKNHINFDMICEIQHPVHQSQIQMSIMDHLMKSKVSDMRLNSIDEFPPLQKDLFEADPWDKDQNSQKSELRDTSQKDSRNKTFWRNGLKKTKINKFKPFKDTPEKFLTLVEWELQLNEAPKIEWVEAFKYFLDPTDGSFLWYQNHRNEFGDNWLILCQLFKDNYSLYHNIDEKKKEFYQLKFEFGKNITFHYYVWNVHRLAKEIDPCCSFTEIRDRVENSVPYLIRNTMLSCQPENEDKLIKLGQRLEKDISMKQKAIRGRNFDSKAFETEIPQSEYSNIEYCQCSPEEQYYDDGEQYIESHAMNSNQQYGNNRFENRQNWQNNQPRFNNPNQQMDQQQRLCYKCHKPGHMFAKCPLNNGQAVLTREGVNPQQSTGNANGEAKENRPVSP